VSFSNVAAAGHAYAVAGRRAKALSVLAELEKLSVEGMFGLRHRDIHVGLAIPRSAMRWLERAYRSAPMGWSISGGSEVGRHAHEPALSRRLPRVGLP